MTVLPGDMSGRPRLSFLGAGRGVPGVPREGAISAKFAARQALCLLLYTKFKGRKNAFIKKFLPHTSYSVPSPRGNRFLLFPTFPSQSVLCLCECSAGEPVRAPGGSPAISRPGTSRPLRCGLHLQTCSGRRTLRKWWGVTSETSLGKPAAAVVGVVAPSLTHGVGGGQSAVVPGRPCGELLRGPCLPATTCASVEADPSPPPPVPQPPIETSGETAAPAVA